MLRASIIVLGQVVVLKARQLRVLDHFAGKIDLCLVHRVIDGNRLYFDFVGGLEFVERHACLLSRAVQLHQTLIYLVIHDERRGSPAP